MMKGLVSLVVVGALASLALSAPQALTNADLDQVTAGAAGALLDNSVAVGGTASANSAAGALADLGAAAVNGDANTLTFDPSDSAIAYADSETINSGYNSYGSATAVGDSQANYSYDPSASAVSLGDDNTATNFYDNGDVANATGASIAVGYADDAANALGAGSLAFEANSDVAVAECGTSVADADDAALNIGYGNIAIEDPSDVTFATDDGVVVQESSDVTLAQDDGLALYNSGQVAATASGIAFADPDDTALAIGAESTAIVDATDVAIADDTAIAATAGLDTLLAIDCSQAFEDNDDVANATGSAPAIASDGAVGLATNHGIAIPYPSDANVAVDGNAAQNTSDGQAVAGNENKSIFQEVYDYYPANETASSSIAYAGGNAIAAMDNATVNVVRNDIDCSTIEDGAAALIGNGNEVSAVYDDAEIEITADDDVTGVITKNADVCGAFNEDDTEIEVEASIADSFTVTTNAMSISGQDGASGIALVSAFGDPETGINLNVTSASATVPTVSAASAPALTVGLSTADTTLTQATINSSYALTVTF